MALLLKNGALFLHVPKTGGSWVTAVLKDQNLIEAEIGNVHDDLTHVLNYPRFYAGNYLKDKIKGKDVFDKVLNSYKFCFVRNPLSWYESFWRFMVGLDWEPFYEKTFPSDRKYYLRGKLFHPNAEIEKYKSGSYNDFIKQVIENYPGYITEFYGWYTTPGYIDYIGKQEDLVENLIDVLHNTKADFDENRIRNFKKVNESKVSIVCDALQPDLLNEIQKLEYPVFKRYGYPIS